jgi:hypothetical protein
MAITAFIAGCESSGGSGGGTGSENSYTLNGIFVQDVNISAGKVDYNHFAATMTRNSLDLNSAQLFFGVTALGFDTTFNVADSVYTFTTSPRSYRAVGATTMNIVDSTLFSDTISTVVLDSIWITNAPDSSIPNTNGTSVFVEWSAVADVDGYIVAVVLDNEAYTGVGYSAYVTDLGPSTTIPPDAFLVNNVVVPGWYNIYVYGYVGSVDSALSGGVLPVVVPSQLTDNIAHTNFTGHFGSVVVSRKTMVQVVSQ